ncbi:diguanylate cyclase [Hydrogenobaculum acidophilum]
METQDCVYKESIKKLIDDYLNTGLIDEEIIKKIGYESYDKTHINYIKHNIDNIKNSFIKEYFQTHKFTEEAYDKIYLFFKIFEENIARGYAIRCIEDSETLESTLYTENILPGLLKSSAQFKDDITKDYIELNETPSITMDAKSCPVYKEIEKSAIPNDVKEDVHKAHERLHYAAQYFYKLIKEKDVENLYGIYWRMRYLNILIVTAIAIYSLESEREFYKTFLEGHSIPILLIDPDTYSIVNANQAALEFYGYTKEEITTLKSWDINTLSEKEMKELISKAKNKEINRFKFKHKLKSGEIRDVDVFSSPILLEGKIYLLSIIYDTTREERAKKFLEILKEIEHISNASDTEEEFLEKLVRLLEKEDISKDVCLMVNKEGTISINSSSMSCVQNEKDKEGNFPIFEAFYLKSPVYHKNIEDIKDEYVKEKLLERGTLSSFAIPILKDGKRYGALCICSNVKEYFEDYELFITQLKEKIENALKSISIRRELNYRNELLKNIAENTQIGVIVFDIENIYYANNYFFELFGYEEKEISQMSIFDVLSPIHTKDIIEAFTNKKSMLLQEFNLINKNNRLVYVKGSLIITKDLTNKDIAIFSFVDITQEKQLRDILTKEKKVLENILDKANFGAFIFKVKNLEALEIELTYKNRYFDTMIKNQDIKTFEDFLILDDDKKELIKSYLKKMTADESGLFTISDITMKKDENVVLKLTMNRVNQNHETLILCILQDITEESKIIKYFEELSTKDALTGVCNRRCLEEKLEEYMTLAKRYDRPLSITMFDIDFFKHINDSYGHDIGDKALKVIANIVSSNIRATDILARYGGEEFVIIAPETTLEDAKALAEKLRQEIERFSFEEDFSITCSFGVISLQKDDTKETLLKRVDDALYQAKRTGRNKVVAL